MNEIPLFLSRTPLFREIAPEETAALLGCLNARKARYERQEILLMAGQPVSSVGIVLSGRVQVVKEDFLGNRNILAEIAPGGLFAESYSCAQAGRFPVTVVSAAQSEILWVDVRKMLAACPEACPFHTKLIENMLAVLASKNILLSRKIEHISKRTTREKLLSYLSDEAARQGKREFDIPFNRQELADYLCVDRSAMSAALGRLQKEGVLRFRRSRFELLREP